MITVEKLFFKYKHTDYILRNINYSFKEDNIYLILGDNGTGKTTLIRLIVGLLKPTSGKIVYDEKKVISYLPDFNGLYEDLSIQDNIKFRLSLYDIRFTNKLDLFLALLEKYNLTDCREKRVSELSMGMKKKVAIIAALLIDADIYVLDEPTGGVDQHSRKEIINMLNEFNIKNRMILCITHESEIIHSLNAKAIYIKDGNLKCIN